MTTNLPTQLINFTHRILWYFSTWIIAALALQVSLKPEGITETSLSITQQRVSWIFCTPVSILIGLAQAFTWPKEVAGWAMAAALMCLLVVAIAAFTQNRAKIFFVTMIVQIIIIIVSFFYLKRLDSLSGGG